MANIEKVIEKLESLGFIEVVLSTTEVFWQKKDVKVSFKHDYLVASKYDTDTMQNIVQHFEFKSPYLFRSLEAVAQW